MKKLSKHIKILVMAFIAMATLIGFMALSGCRNNRNAEFTLLFNSNGGSVVENMTVQQNQSVMLLPAPQKEGRNFLGWFFDEELTQQAVIPLEVSGNITLFAKWEGPNTITFNTMGGTAVESITALTGTHLTAPGEPEKTGYRFGGWYEDTALTRPSEFYFGRRMSAGDITLFARWNALIRLTLSGASATIELEDGTVSGHNNHFYFVSAEIINEPNIESVSGQVFLGWFFESTGGLPIRFPVRIGENTTLYARFRPLATNLSISFDGFGTVPNTITGRTEGQEVSLSALTDTITQATHPIQFNHYFFDGWIDQFGVLHRDNITVGTSNLNLTANWIRRAIYARVEFVVTSPHDIAMPTVNRIEYLRKVTLFNLDTLFAILTTGQNLTGLSYAFVGEDENILGRVSNTIARGFEVIADTTVALTFFHTASEGLEYEFIYRFSHINTQNQRVYVRDSKRVVGFRNNTTIPTTVVIPAIVDGFWVREIGYRAFISLNLTSVILPEGLRVIALNAFRNNNINTPLRFPSTITAIGMYAFNGNTNLTANLITFAGLDNLTSMPSGGVFNVGTIPLVNSLALIPCLNGYHILYRQQITSSAFTVPNTVRFIAGSAFSNNQHITQLTIPNSVRNMGSFAFANSVVEDVTLPIGLTTIAMGLFNGATNLHTINIPGTVTTIGQAAFANTAITNLAIPNVQRIEFEAFRGSSINEIQLGSALIFLGEGAFRDTPYLFTINMQSTRIEDVFPYTFSNSGILTIVRLPNTVWEIHYRAFYGASSLYLVHIGTSTGSNLVEIHEYAFAGTALRSLVIRTDYNNASGEGNNPFIATAGVNIASSALPMGQHIKVFVEGGGIMVGGVPRSQTYVDLYTSVFNTMGFGDYITVTQLDIEPPEAFLSGEDTVAVAGLVNLAEALSRWVRVEDNVTAHEDIKFIVLLVEFEGESLEPISPNSNYFMLEEIGTYLVLFHIEDEFGNRITRMLDFTIVAG